MEDTKKTDSTLTDDQIIHAVKNDHEEAFFVLGDRKFPYRDLEYDDYLDFIRKAKPVVEAAAGGLLIEGNDLSFNPVGMNIDTILELAGKELPHMAWLCAKQSDPKITIAQVKKLARRPQQLIEVVLGQVKHNDLIREFSDFFPRVMTALLALAPDLKTAIAPVEATESMTDETR